MNINFLSEVIPYVHYHKERWDGKGEPEGLKGNSIPFGSRIIAVADAYDAMTSKRSYRDPLPQATVRQIFIEEMGSPEEVFDNPTSPKTRAFLNKSLESF